MRVFSRSRLAAQCSCARFVSIFAYAMDIQRQDWRINGIYMSDKNELNVLYNEIRPFTAWVRSLIVLIGSGANRLSCEDCLDNDGELRDRRRCRRRRRCHY
jgi:hypothetical protein